MAIQGVVATEFGEQRSLYIRLNNIEASNHGVPCNVKFRGFISKETFDSGSRYLWEMDIEFIADVSLPLWAQAYDALKMQVNIADAMDLPD